ncbi:sugar kinase [Streptomyces fructofermentans]|uniref:Carbohydrate kinase n=1 Tax=Streptomyces fructofermentans TaxID=152141 RepID=A0A918K0F4_9ACTN|nr:sugar kinase [Streptomyces fructofermentans]GGX39689.1 carbohydrate kinase [Streptomyces fructofermentans]
MTPTGPAPTDAAQTVDVVALGESMVTFLPSGPGRLADVPSFERGIGGAESNVACVLAAAGHRAAWVSRVGDDGFGDHLVEAIGAYGVDTSAVTRDPERPTGIYFRTAGDRATDAHEVAYYRAGSAASAMSAGTVDPAVVRSGRVLHLSGITAALSEGCLGLLRELTERRPGRPIVSFDVNHRPGLWNTPEGPRVLLDLAHGADIVFVGDDEARAAWGLHGAHAVRAALPEPDVLVVKHGRAGATAFAREPAPEDVHAVPGGEPAGPVGVRADRSRARRGGGRADRGGAERGGEQAAEAAVFVPALRVDVVAAVGAGDAFAAGFLSATLRGLPVRDRLRHGHLMAAAALTVPGDLAAPPAREHADRLAALDDDAWGTLRLGPGWTQAADRTADRAQEEVRTP